MSDDSVVIGTFIPENYMDRIDEAGEILDKDYNPNGIYRFYGVFIGEKQRIGFIKYHVEFALPSIEIDRMEVDSSYRGQGYGTMLLNHSLCELITSFPHIEDVTVCSSASAIQFYSRNGFVPYFGDNNLVRTLRKK